MNDRINGGSAEPMTHNLAFAVAACALVAFLGLPRPADALPAVAAATPKLSPAPGTYGPAQTVTLSDATAGATLFFTTNGTTPTTASTKYTAAFKIVATTTVKAIAVKAGDTTSAVASGTYTITSPSGLTYPATPPLLLGKAVSLTPHVTGTGVAFTVAPALPTGVVINATTGVISGTPTKVTAPLTYTVTAKNSSGSTIDALKLRVDLGPTVHLTATASDTAGTTLTYRWKTTDGSLLNVNAYQADWELPPGPGLHFAYVLVSNAKGGYTQERVAVDTDTIGNPVIIPAATTYAAPAAPAPTTVPVRGLMQFGQTVGALPRTVLNPGPGVGGAAIDSTGTVVVPTLGFATPNYRGETVFDMPLGFGFNDSGTCTFDPGVTSFPCIMPYAPNAGFAVTSAFTGYFGSTGLTSAYTGTGLLPGGSPCGTANEFFGVFSLATVELLNAGGAVISGPYSADVYGGYLIPASASAKSLRLSCEGVTPVVLSLASAISDGSGNHYLGSTALPAPEPPTVSAMSATYNGSVIGVFPSPAPVPADPTPPSNKVPYSDRFLGQKGIDSRIGACQYYRAIGAVKSCDAAGKPTGAISFQDWKRTVRIDSFAPPGSPPTYAATYINKVDLNLARVHHSISYGANETAAYVCNHAGPTVLNPPQSTDGSNNPSVNTVIANTIAGKNLVACVAMDYFVTPGVNGNKPFTRFLIFGPSGQLLPSINLDGRVEKFVPGTCVVCHGGDFYAGKYPEDGTGRADVGGRFVPYDTGNFEFSTAAGLTEAAQELSIFHLNQNVLKAGPNTATSELIAGWYTGGSTTLNKNYLPASWVGHGATATNFYLDVIARSCRTCHVSMGEAYDFEHYPMGGLNNPNPGSAPDLDVAQTVCGPKLPSGTNERHYEMLRSHSMPNSLVTFNRFWNTQGSTLPTVPDQPKLTLAFVNSVAAFGTFVDCSLALPPN